MKKIICFKGVRKQINGSYHDIIWMFETIWNFKIVYACREVALFFACEILHLLRRVSHGVGVSRILPKIGLQFAVYVKAHVASKLLRYGRFLQGANSCPNSLTAAWSFAIVQKSSVVALI